MTQDTPIPEGIFTAMQDLVDRISDREIFEYAEAHQKKITPGFQPVIKNVRHFRSKMKALIGARIFARDDGLLELLPEADLHWKFIIVLSPEALKEGLELFMAYFGKERFLANLLLDTRETVQQLALDYMAQDEWQKKSLPDRAEAVEGIRACFSPFLKLVAPFVRNNRGVAEEGDVLQKRNIEISSLKRELKETREELIDSKSLAIATRKQYQAEAREKAEVEKRLKRELAQVRSDKDRLSADNTVLRNAAEEKDRELQNLKRSFFHDDLLIKAEEALAASVMQNKHSPGAVFNSELTLIRTLDLAQCFCLLNMYFSQPSNETGDTLEQLLRKASNIRSGLGINGNTSPLYRSFHERINTSRSPDELANLFDFLCRVNEHALLTLDEVTNLSEICRTKWHAIYKGYSLRGRTAFRSGSNPTTGLTRALIEDIPFALFLDAYNIVRARELESIFLPYYEGGRPGRKVREHLLNIVAKNVERSEKVEVRVYCDSSKPSIESWSANVKAIYSGIPEKHSADIAILEDLYYRQNHPNVPRCLVSNDRRLAEEAFALETSVISVQQFKEVFFRQQNGIATRGLVRC